jgi:hypothetical protein
MSSAGDSRHRSSSGLNPMTVALASLGSVVATALVSGFGLAGTLAGAALAPVVVSLVGEIGRRPVERVVRLPSGARALVERRPRVRPRVVALTAAAGFAIAVGVVTLPDLIAGESVVSERPTTFFSDGGGSGGSGAPAQGDGRTEPEMRTETAPAVTAPEDPATTTAPATEPPPATTAPPVTPAPVAPAPVTPAPAPPPAAPPADPAAPATTDTAPAPDPAQPTG